ncbi:hypothetical protein NKR19_g6694 [Coniochaeta hoffmannii]|uniref:ATP synthase subunit K, mitochondrial n=1 Tax=Coniochaeta hoffmannii TaxID=91930 RepID=A0AA38RR87_9PEZI|nr:hypothetical protein NKR19_g6694 [Coniochaeta hoffmannii]
MVQYYNIFGRQVGSHHLAMGVLATIFGGSYVALSSPSKTPAAAPPINASSSDEADFIKKFLEQAEAEDKKAKH